VFAALEQRGRDDLAGAGTDGTDPVTVERSVDVRFRGQAHQLTVAVPGGRLTDADLRTVVRAYHDRYRAAYGIELHAPVQLVSFRVRVVRTVDKLDPHPGPLGPPNAPTPDGERLAYFPELGGFTPVPVFAWSTLQPGEVLTGAALNDGADTTVVIPPGWVATVDGWLNLRLATTPGPAVAGDGRS
jgi:N-methylhydantoinase A/oxoprolinase/acetone carboxylase beta subunit